MFLHSYSCPWCHHQILARCGIILHFFPCCYFSCTDRKFCCKTEKFNFENKTFPPQNSEPRKVCCHWSQAYPGSALNFRMSLTSHLGTSHSIQKNSEFGAGNHPDFFQIFHWMAISPHFLTYVLNALENQLSFGSLDMIFCVIAQLSWSLLG